jgi:predicted dehydrogenase
VTAPIGVGFIGTGWMSRAHAHALHTLHHIAPDLRRARLVAIAGRDPVRTEAAAAGLGFERATTDWRSVVDDPAVQIVANLAANDIHPQPSVAALQVGKSVLCEKPLASSLEEAEQMTAAAAASPGLAVCGYNYRFVPAVRLARQLVTSGRLGTVRHVRGAYLQDFAGTAEARRGWRFSDPQQGSAVADYSHVIDLVRWLAGEPVEVAALIGTLDEKAESLRVATVGEDHEDWYAALLRLGSGATATLEASRVATGRKNDHCIEIYGSAGSVWWSLEDLNRLHVYLRDDEAELTAGFRDVLVTEPGHPYLEHWWASGHILGWEHTFAHEWLDTLRAVDSGGETPDGLPLFTDGLAAVRIATAIRSSAQTGRWTPLL